MPLPPWKRAEGLPHVLETWSQNALLGSCISARKTIAASEAAEVEFPPDLQPNLQAALRKRGIERLYTHQREAFTEANKGRAVVIATPTASGKSLCFHLPVLQTMANDAEATAIFLYPTKALARDQEANLRALIKDAGMSTPAVVYDGDTPGDARRVAREKTRIVMTNPDMIHSGILPHHAGWARALSNLRYVVVDELHTYRGVFGSHVAHVLTRLRRIARFHGADPTFLCATATIGNPREHASKLLGVPESEISLITESGAPRGAREVLIYNPPVVNAELGIRASYLKSVVKLTADLLRAGVSTIVFGPSRNSVEIMLKYLRESLVGSVSEDAIMAYRGGYLPETRRAVEHGLRDGSILGVVATNALELGIDIGELDAVVCAGYPGSVAATWQRFGRAGRRGKLSLSILVTASNPIDQFMAHSPDFVLDASSEHARIDPENTEILIQHLKCAAFELPFSDREPYASLPVDESRQALGFLEEHGVVHEEGGRFHWSTDKYPANHVSLRSVSWDNTVIIDAETHKTLAELDWRATPTMLHEQAIYQHDGEQYQVERLDYENHKAFVRKVRPDYFTTAMTHRKVTPLDTFRDRPLHRGTSVFGEVSVVEKVVGFKKIKFHTHQNSGYGEIRLPEIQMHTSAYWSTMPSAVCLEAGFDRSTAIEGLRGILSGLETVATVSLMCEPRDLGRALEDGDLGHDEASSAYQPTLFLFDNTPGGIGLSERIFERAEELMLRTAQLLSRCDCIDGCPLCVGASGGEGGRQASRKSAASALLRAFLGVGVPQVEGARSSEA